ncbi:LysR family transcriptional regulator [Sandaracinus amylolyticus]|uniref:LysR family transcriptional regulator n=1 Tax=Sandaracinus amylolyticus TaxID=927083 RepID=UPI001F2B37D1|nr:LysR family transcriptional regulator [Sandaracinus amylolyticus]UJR85600.1 Hypothetical protein I5071_76800 [Sandaracinus amylolyticus]
MAPNAELSRWDDVRVFLAVVRQGSFTLAAQTLETDQSTVSRRIAALESELGGPLFERTPRGPVTTELGARLREDAERIEAEVHRFADAALGHERDVRGRVRIATTEGIALHFVVPRVLPALREAYPELELELVTSDRAVDLAAREADVAIRFFRTTRGDLVGRRVARLRTGVLATKALAKRARRRDPASLAWIATEIDGVATPEAAWLAQHVSTPPVLRCSSYEVQVAAIRAGLGVGLAPLALRRVYPELAPIEGLPAGPTLELHVVTRRAIRTLPRIAAVIDALVEHLAAIDR